MSDPLNFNTDPQKIAKLWFHECKRVFEDRLVFQEDINKFQEYLNKAFQVLVDGYLTINEEQMEDIMDDSNVFTTFISAI